MTAPNLDNSILNQLTERIGDLYSLPAVAMKVLRLTETKTVDVRALKACIENDPALTCRILKVVNSSMYGLSREITDLNEALTVLGIDPLKMLVLGFSLPAKLFDGVESSVMSRYWKHSLTKAAAARRVGRAFFDHASDDTFVAGLLQDIGMLALIQELGEPYLEFLDKVDLEDGDLVSLEIATMGFDHRLLSARLLQRWQIPNTLVKSIGLSQHVSVLSALDGYEGRLARILHLAELISQVVLDESSKAIVFLDQAFAAYCGRDMAALEDLLPEVQNDVEQLADVLAVTWDDAGEYLDLMRRSRERLAELSNAAIAMLLEVESSNQARTSGPNVVYGGQTDTSLKHDDSNLTRTFPGGPQSKQTRETGLELQSIHHEQTVELEDPGLLGRVAISAGRCRQRREPLSLMFMEIDRFLQMLASQTIEDVRHMIKVLETAIIAIQDPHDQMIQIADQRFALLLEGCDQHEASDMAKQLLHGIRRWSEGRVSESKSSMKVSIGLATVSLPPKNFIPEELIESAERCVETASLAGGDTLKSISM